jgi:ABC-type maltose transport system permease subunit
MMIPFVVTMIPIFLLYSFGQRFFVEGIAMTGLKG